VPPGLARLSIDQKEVGVVVTAVGHLGIVTAIDELVDIAYVVLMEVTGLHYQ
jgi:hypothetical protein